MGSISDDGPGHYNPDRNEDPWGKVALAACTVVHRRTAAPRLRTRIGCRQRRARRADANRTTRRTRSRTGRPRLIYRPSSRTGENPLYGMIGRTMETAASFEARFAPSSYPAGPWGKRQWPFERCCTSAPRPSTRIEALTLQVARCTKDGGKPCDAMNS
jgi:hypothetical protein